MTARPPYVDALARRLPRREPAPERAAALRHALLDAAEAPGARRSGIPVRRWVVGGGIALAAACALLALALRGPGPTPERSPRITGTAAPAATAATAEPSRPGAGTPRTTTATNAGPDAPGAPGEPLPDGISTFHATHPLQLTGANTRITAPPGAQFEVDVRGGEVRLVTVRSGWVVVAAAHTTTMVVERQTWIPAAPPDPAPGGAPPVPAPSSTTGPPTAPRSGPPSPTAPPPPPPAITAARPASDRAPDRAAPTAAQAPATAGSAAAPPAGPIDAAAQQATTAELAFHDGLQALLAGRPGAAIAPLDRACALPSTSQDDICYWAAIAWLRAGDRGHARQALSDVLAHWPGSTHTGEARVALGWLLLDAGDRDAARARFAAARSDRMPHVRAEAARGLAAAQ